MPTTWSELTETQFLYVIGLLAMGVSAERTQVYAFLRFAGLGIVKADADTLLLRRDGDLCRIARRDLLLGAMSLDFMQEPPDVPQRPAEWQGRKAVDAQMHGVPFGHYLQIENYMQRYIAQPDDSLLLPMAALLYPGLSPKNVPPLLRYAMLHWLTGLKLFLHIYKRIRGRIHAKKRDTKQQGLCKNRSNYVYNCSNEFMWLWKTGNRNTNTGRGTG